MSSRSPYMPLYISDYLSDAAHLSTLEHGAYLLLIMNYWQRGKALPADDAKLSKICNLKFSKWIKMKPTLAQFFSISDSTWSHLRIEKELAISREKSDRARISAEKRWTNKEEKNDANAMRLECERNANAMRTQCYNVINKDVSNTEDIKKKIKKEKSFESDEPKTFDQVLTEVSPETSALTFKKNSVDKSKKLDIIASVFAHWQTVHGKPRAKLDAKRHRLIERALGQGYTVDQLKQAINGCLKSKFHSGMNSTKTIYNDLSLILRDAAKIEQFIGFDEGSQISQTEDLAELERQREIRAFGEPAQDETRGDIFGEIEDVQRGKG